MKTVTFKVLLMWDDVAWIAETIGDYWYVAQGDTPERTLANLITGLCLTAEHQESRGFVPFKASTQMATPPDVLSKLNGAVTYYRGASDKQKRYVTYVNV